VETIVALALAAAASLVVQLLAVVLVILSRPRPKALLWAFWLSAVVVNVGFGLVLLVLFRANGTFLGANDTTVNPVLYIVIGGIAIAAALFAATKRGRDLIGRELEKSKDHPEASGSVGDRVRAKADEFKAKAEASLTRGSVVVAIVAGLLLGTTTPFQVGAIGLTVRNGYSLPLQLLLTIVFTLITYIVVEVPVLSYTIRPDATAARVATFSEWLDSNKIQVAAGIAAIVGVVLIIKGLTSL
jgi:Sap, sulfolipid-1-addressing protein